MLDSNLSLTMYRQTTYGVKLDATPTRIKIVRPCWINGREWRPGETLELERWVADDVVFTGRAAFCGE